jgi:ferredoxin
MKTGPKADSGYDLSITEMNDKGGWIYMIHAGSGKGEDLCENLELTGIADDQKDRIDDYIDAVFSKMPVRFDKDEISFALKDQYENTRWEDVASRCLSCANCTMVCPTCFCTSTEDVNDLTGDHSERWLTWDSCFNGDFTFIHGGQIRDTTRSRYRQWLTHKFSTWYDQFGSAGCVGCGRCITWCPVAIDVTEELVALNP